MSRQGEVVVMLYKMMFAIEEVGLIVIVISFFRVENAGTMRDRRKKPWIGGLVPAESWK